MADDPASQQLLHLTMRGVHATERGARIGAWGLLVATLTLALAIRSDVFGRWNTAQKAEASHEQRQQVSLIPQVESQTTAPVTAQPDVAIKEPPPQVEPASRYPATAPLVQREPAPRFAPVRGRREPAFTEVPTTDTSRPTREDRVNMLAFTERPTE